MGRKEAATLLLSTAVAFSIASVRPSSAAIQYKIKPGDSLWTIARKYDTHVQDIQQANHIKSGAVLRLGRVITIPAPAPQPARGAKTISKSTVKKLPASQSMVSIKHKIVNGDSLWTIARRYDTHIRDIALANNMKADETLRIGRVLTVPVSASAAKRIARGKIAYKSKRIQTVKQTNSYKDNKRTQVASADVGGLNIRNSVVRRALSYRGVRYRRGGSSAKGFDCSGFTRYIYKKHGVSLPHSSRAQAQVGKSVPRNQLKPGDIVCFHTYRRGVSHVGIYIGNNKFVHASSSGGRVRTDSLGEGYYNARYRGARRVQ